MLILHLHARHIRASASIISSSIEHTLRPTECIILIQPLFMLLQKLRHETMAYPIKKGTNLECQQMEQCLLTMESDASRLDTTLTVSTIST
jgi:hypothetical protein